MCARFEQQSETFFPGQIWSARPIPPHPVEADLAGVARSLREKHPRMSHGSAAGRRSPAAAEERATRKTRMASRRELG